MGLRWEVKKDMGKVFPLRKYVITVYDGAGVLLDRRFFGVLFPKLMWKRLARKIHRNMVALAAEAKAVRTALEKAPK